MKQNWWRIVLFGIVGAGLIWAGTWYNKQYQDKLAQGHNEEIAAQQKQQNDDGEEHLYNIQRKMNYVHKQNRPTDGAQPKQTDENPRSAY